MANFSQKCHTKFEENGEFILWGIGKTDWEIPHWFPPSAFRNPSPSAADVICERSLIATLYATVTVRFFSVCAWPQTSQEATNAVLPVTRVNFVFVNVTDWFTLHIYYYLIVRWIGMRPSDGVLAMFRISTGYNSQIEVKARH